jgi:hypothetical protein
MKIPYLIFFSLFLFSLSAQNVGINNVDPKSSLDVKGSLIVSDFQYLVGQQGSNPVSFYTITSGQVYSDSTGILYDDGGLNNPYQPNQFYDVIVDVPGAILNQIDVYSMDTESPYDSLSITSLSSGTHLATLYGNQIGKFQVSGPIQITFSSNAVNQGAGFGIRWDGLFDNPIVNESQNVGSGGRLQYLGQKNALRSGFVEGQQWDTDQVGTNSLASGKNAQARGNQSVALGDGTIANGENEMAIGKYNAPQQGALFQIGNGVDNSLRNNAMTVYQNGNVEFDGIISGNGSGLTNLPIAPSIWNLNGSSDTYYNYGDVGIGTSSPNGSLEVNSNSSLSDPQIKLHENGNDYARINFDNNNGSNYWTIAGYIASNHRNDRLNFWNGTGGDVMTITGDGEVGIGVGISPKVPFHVGNGRRVLFGIDTLGNGDKLMFLPDLHAFRVGTVATGAASTYWNRDSIGLYSFASGFNTRAQGYGATAMGRDTEATNSYAFASGFFSNADGQYSTAMGFNTDALALGSTALGYSTDAEANYSFAAGYFAEAQAIYSIALGNAVQAQSYASMAVGRYNVGGGSATSWNTNDPIFEIGIGTGPSTRENAMMVRKNGNVGIGTNSPGARLHVANGELRIGSLEEFSDGGSFLIQVNSAFAPLTNGDRTLGNSSFRWSTVYATNGSINTSDAREKENIVDIQYGLNEVMRLRPVAFNWIRQPEMGTKLGLIAQEVIEVIGEVVVDKEWVTNEQTGQQTEVEADRMGIYYSDLIPVLIKSIQEQQAEIEALKKRISILEK